MKITNIALGSILLLCVGSSYAQSITVCNDPTSDKGYALKLQSGGFWADHNMGDDDGIPPGECGSVNLEVPSLDYLNQHGLDVSIKPDYVVIPYYSKHFTSDDDLDALYSGDCSLDAMLQKGTWSDKASIEITCASHRKNK